MKAIKITVITLFAIVAVFWGVLVSGCKDKKETIPFPEMHYHVYQRSSDTSDMPQHGVVIFDTVYIHDTIYRTKTVNIDNAKSVTIGGDSNGDIIQKN